MTELESQPPELLDGDAPDKPVEELTRMTLLGHLEELRSRIIRCLIAAIIAFVACLPFVKDIYRFLERPILNVLPEGEKLIFLKLTDPLFLYVKVSALVGLFLISPYLLFQVWRFRGSGALQERKTILDTLRLLRLTFFLAGGTFAYLVAFLSRSSF